MEHEKTLFTEVLFNGKKYWMLSSDVPNNGPLLSSIEQYENFEPSYAHVVDGSVIRFGEHIPGTVTLNNEK